MTITLPGSVVVRGNAVNSQSLRCLVDLIRSPHNPKIKSLTLLPDCLLSRDVYLFDPRFIRSAIASGALLRDGHVATPGAKSLARARLRWSSNFVGS